jgi:hypothetical protein
LINNAGPHNWRYAIKLPAPLEHSGKSNVAGIFMYKPTSYNPDNGISMPFFPILHLVYNTYSGDILGGEAMTNRCMTRHLLSVSIKNIYKDYKGLILFYLSFCHFNGIADIY